MTGIRAFAVDQYRNRPRVVGDWESYSDQELDRVRRELSAAQRATAPWDRALGVWSALGLLAGLAVLAEAGSVWALLLCPFVGLFAGGGMVWIKTRMVAHRPVLGWWRSWRQARRALGHMLVRGLDDAWVVLADRVGAGFAFPVTVAVGPSGTWVVWVAEPTVPLEHPSALASWLAEVVGDPGARAWVLVGPRYDHTAGTGIVAEVRTGPVRYGPREVAATAERIEVLTRPEPMEVLAC